ncbi:MAG TPA: hypothetical protein VG458_09420, partial [Solirubrobacterales bacterium]|nr:hypothetical protein [Solirubrobacterales bacterium]
MVEADFQAHYSIDLREIAEVEGCRRLWVLIQGLPAGAATWRVGGHEWTALHELLAINAEVADSWGVANARLNGGAKALKDYTPLRIPRPGETSEGKAKRQKSEATP